jgi:hypothetical protein
MTEQGSPIAKTGILCGLAILLACAAGAAEALPSEKDVLNRVIERASQVASKENLEKYAYAKRSLVQELNSSGKAIHSTEKKYEVLLIQGWPFTRLVQVQGQQLSEAEIRKEERREQEFRNKVAGGDLKRRREKREAWITPELLGRYDFNVISNDVYLDRNALVLEFKPKPTNPQDSIQDKILNRFSGRLWVDSEDSEIAKVDAHLTGEVTLGWLGTLGSLSECDLTMQRQRMPEGVWVNAKHTLLIVGRKLFSTMRYRTTEESSDFRHEQQSGKGVL